MPTAFKLSFGGKYYIYIYVYLTVENGSKLYY